jgi:biotin operon repressor
MPFERSLEIERRLDEVLRMIRTGRFSTPRLAEEVGVSIPTISRIVAALRERGHDIQAERTSRGWRYVIISARRSGLPGNAKTSVPGEANPSELRGNSERSKVRR